MLNGHIECVQYLHENEADWSSDMLQVAVKKVYLDILVYALENSCPASCEFACSNVATFGHLECLMYLHRNGVPWDSLTCEEAAKNGHIDCLRYAFSNGCPCTEATGYMAARRGKTE